jgi:hypothetical protein
LSQRDTENATLKKGEFEEDACGSGESAGEREVEVVPEAAAAAEEEDFLKHSGQRVRAHFLQPLKGPCFEIPQLHSPHVRAVGARYGCKTP